jgi:hypothetical protein
MPNPYAGRALARDSFMIAKRRQDVADDQPASSHESTKPRVTNAPGEMPQMSWKHSPERLAARRRIAYALAVLAVFIVVIGIALAVRWQIDKADAELADNIYNKADNDAYPSYSDLQASSSEDRPAKLAAYQAAQERERAASDALAKATQRVKTTSALIYPYIAGVIAAAVLSVVAARFYLAESRRTFDTEALLAEIERDARERGQAAAGPGGDPLALTALWVENRARIEGYHSLVTSYAASTRRITRTVLTVGFGFLFVTGLLSLFASTPSASVATSVVAVAGAGLGAFVSSAVLKNAETSANEVQAFFAHPLHLERQLTMERLLREMQEPELSKARLALITGFSPQASAESKSAGGGQNEPNSQSTLAT